MLDIWVSLLQDTHEARAGNVTAGSDQKQDKTARDVCLLQSALLGCQLTGVIIAFW